MKKLFLIFLFFLWLAPVNTQEPEPKKVTKKIKTDTTKMDSIFIQQKAYELKIDSSLIIIKEQNAQMEELRKEDI